MSPKVTSDGACPYPVVLGLGMCCGNASDCDMRFWRPCDATGGCLDRATCGGCGVPDLRRGERRKTGRYTSFYSNRTPRGGAHRSWMERRHAE